MKKRLVDFEKEAQLNHIELSKIKGGYARRGPDDDLVDDDIDIPNLTLAPGPDDDLVDDDIDIPNLTLAPVRRSFSRTRGIGQII
jgi:hypothetical protein